MQIYVCVKHVPDTAAKITVVGGTGFAETCKFIVNPYDEYGIEEAVQQVKQAGSGEVIVVTVGKESAMVTMRAALAQGADRAKGFVVRAGKYGNKVVRQTLDGHECAQLGTAFATEPHL